MAPKNLLHAHVPQTRILPCFTDEIALYCSQTLTGFKFIHQKWGVTAKEASNSVQHFTTAILWRMNAISAEQVMLRYWYHAQAISEPIIVVFTA